MAVVAIFESPPADIIGLCCRLFGDHSFLQSHNRIEFLMKAGEYLSIAGCGQHSWAKGSKGQEAKVNKTDFRYIAYAEARE